MAAAGRYHEIDRLGAEDTRGSILVFFIRLTGISDTIWVIYVCVTVCV